MYRQAVLRFAALRLRDAGESVDLSWLQTTIDLTDGADVPDMVRARLHKVTGLTLRDAGMNAEALAQFQRAMQLDRNAGVRKEIERLERALKPKAEAPPVKRLNRARANLSPDRQQSAGVHQRR